MGQFKIIQPQSIKNLWDNPSFERDLTGWSSGSTLVRSSAKSTRGHYSAKFTYTVSTQVISATPTLDTNSRYFVAFDVNTEDFDKPVELAHSLFTGATTVVADVPVAAGSDWTRIWMIFDTASDGAGQIFLQNTGGAGTGDVYVDRATLVKIGATDTWEVTYVDGDMDGAWWEFDPHSDPSGAGPNDRRYGYILDMGDDLGWEVERVSGLGFPQVKNVSLARPLGPGAQHQMTTIQPTQLVMNGTFLGSTLADYHVARKALVAAVTPEEGPSQAPVLIGYTGAGTRKWLQARYVSGLELNGPRGFNEEASVIFTADEWPFWVREFESAQALDDWDTDSHDYLTLLKNYDGSGDWDMVGGDGTGPASTLLHEVFQDSQGRIWVGGSFTTYRGATRNGLAYYDRKAGTWNSVGTGAGGSSPVVWAIREGPDGLIWIGGEFDTLNGVTCRGIATWNGTTVAAVGPPSTGGKVYAIEFDDLGNTYLGGDFTNWNGNGFSDYVVRWTGSAYEPVDDLGSYLNGIVRALQYDPASQKLYIGGQFSQVQNPTANVGKLVHHPAGGAYVDDYDVTGNVHSLDLDDLGNLWVAGEFSSAGGVSVSKVTRYDGNVFHDLGPSQGFVTSGVSYRIRADQKGGAWVGGYITTINNVFGREYLYYFTGSSWVIPDVDSATVAKPRGLWVTPDGDVIVSWDNYGGFDYSGTTVVNNPGTGRAWPVIYIRWTANSGTCIPLVIKNMTTGKTLWMATPMVLGQSITIDLQPGKTKMWTKMGLDVRAREVWKILPSSDVADFFLVPGDNRLKVFTVKTSGGTDPTTEAFIRFQVNDTGAD